MRDARQAGTKLAVTATAARSTAASANPVGSNGLVSNKSVRIARERERARKADRDIFLSHSRQSEYRYFPHSEMTAPDFTSSYAMAIAW